MYNSSFRLSFLINSWFEPILLFFWNIGWENAKSAHPLPPVLMYPTLLLTTHLGTTYCAARSKWWLYCQLTSSSYEVCKCVLVCASTVGRLFCYKPGKAVLIRVHSRFEFQLGHSKLNCNFDLYWYETSPIINFWF